MIDYSIVIPVYNEEGSLRPLLEEIIQAVGGLNRSYEVIFINDYSSDASTDILEEFVQKFPEIVRVITLTQRTGQTIAMRKGLDKSSGQIVVTLDADLQNDPADILKLFVKMEEGYDCVCAWRKARQDTPFKAGMSKFGNGVQRLFTGMKIHDISCTLRAYKKHCVDKIPLIWEGQHRFIPLCLFLQGFKVSEIISNHRQRKYGHSKYSYKRVFRVAFDFFKILAVRDCK